MLTPGIVCERLDISPSTLRKYCIRFEKEGIEFKRNKNNSRIFTATEVVALQEAITLTKNGGKTFENAVLEASNHLKGHKNITAENAVTEPTLQRHDNDATAVMMKHLEVLHKENQELREEIKKRDTLFVEALEKMDAKLTRIESYQNQLENPKPNDQDEKENGSSLDQAEASIQDSLPQHDNRSLWQKIWRK